MPTIPTGDMEKELRKLYLRWLSGLSYDSDNLAGKISAFQAQSEALIAKMGGRVAALGALGDFPAPRLLELSPYAGKIYDGMQQAAIQAGVAAGMNSVDVARAMFQNGMDKSFNQLKRLARTETTNAYWKNAFDSVADLPALVMVWGSEDGPRTCAWCRERDGLVMDSPSLRDHPNGRCTPIPTLRSRVQYRGSIDANGRIYHDPNWNKATKPAPMEEVKAVIGQPTPQELDVRTFGQDVTPKVRKERISAGDWRYVDDRSQRAAVLLQNDYRAEQAIKKMAKAIREGEDIKVPIPRAWAKDFTGNVTDVAGTRYTEQQVRDALEDAARWLVEQDTKSPRVMYKGLDVPKDKIAKLFKEGAPFDTNYSSFTTDEVVARGYSSRRATAQVIVRVKNAPGVAINGNPTADFWKKTKEHLVTGKGRVTGVTEAHNGRTIYVDVTF